MSGRKHAGPKLIHEAWLLPDSLTFITVDDAWDVNWVEGPPTAADLTKCRTTCKLLRLPGAEGMSDPGNSGGEQPNQERE